MALGRRGKEQQVQDPLRLGDQHRCCRFHGGGIIARADGPVDLWPIKVTPRTKGEPLPRIAPEQGRCTTYRWSKLQPYGVIAAMVFSSTALT